MLDAVLAFFTSVFGFFGVHTLAAPVTPPPFLPPAPHMRVLFAGDTMFDRSIRTAMKEKGGDFIFSCIDPVLKDADLVVANLEGPITAHASKSVGTTPGGEFNYTFTFPTSTAPLLAKHGIRIVNVGNNHILNFGYDGLDSTRAHLTDAGVSFFGDVPDNTMIYHSAFGGVAVAFINFNEFGGGASTTLGQIAAAKEKGEVPIVYTHWGVEYATTSSAYSRELAHRFVDAGAEIVIGSHPHVVQEREYYKGKYIYYSLGNFVFDQYWNDDVRHGLLVEAAFTQEGVEWVQEIPVELGRDRRTCPASLSTTTALTQP